MSLLPRFPPLFQGMGAGPADPFKVACDQARRGVDAGLIVWSIGDERVRAAMVLAPDDPLRVGMAALPACAVGFQNALGVLAPAETAVHLEWPGGIRINGGHCGGFHVAASTRNPDEVPDWLVIALDLALTLPADFEPGQTPDWTALYSEGCRDVDPVDLLEAWARHSLIWLNELENTAGRARLHTEWQGLMWRKDKPQSVVLPTGRHHGTLLGADENFGLLVKGESVALLPLSDMLEDM